ncbi:MAG: bacterial transcriptional activator domain-containing protein [Bacteroidota bacterium]
MIVAEHQIEAILEKQSTATLRVQTLGNFQLWRQSEPVDTKAWGRDVALQLFQFFIAYRHRRGLHKEQIIDQIWYDADSKSGQQNFKVAHHGMNKAIEPNRKSRAEPKYIIRQGQSYQLDLHDMWVDVEAFDQLITLGNQALLEDKAVAKRAYREAIQLYKGGFLPNRIYEDWSTEERERIQLLALGAMINLSELLLQENPLESIRLTQKALQLDATWEEAYRIQMAAYLEKGNRPMALKTYQQCKRVLDEEFGIQPLPETKKLFEKIKAIH